MFSELNNTVAECDGRDNVSTGSGLQLYYRYSIIDTERQHSKLCRDFATLTTRRRISVATAACTSLRLVVSNCFDLIDLNIV